MKSRTIQILMVAALVAMGAAHRNRSTAPRRPAEAEPAPPQVQTADGPKLDVRAAVPPPPKPAPKRPEPIAAPESAAPQARKKPDAAAERRRRAREYWRQVGRRFEQQEEALARENDPAKRMKLIKAMARNVRIDTPATLN